MLPAPLLLASCTDPEVTEINQTTPSPALWQVETSDGEIEGWLFGTIHALPDGFEWRTAKLTSIIDRAGVLVVEISGLNDDKAVSDVFSELATTPDLPPLQERVEYRYRKDLSALMATGNYRGGSFTATESWAAALTLAQISASGDPKNGVDRALLNEFASKPVIELEGARIQLGIFDSLAEADQRDLLEAIILEAATSDPDEADKLSVVWRSGDMDRLAQENSEGLLADPELRDALLTGRNLAWERKLAGLWPQHGPMLVAVGAAHLAGEDGLPVLLAKKGFKVTRIQ
ncbi:TraB/GumN family protein [Pontixanthobacter gangjinensis]|uniref:TraB/GumN family protein n=1 Tax=Pontixanthobacter gangjinensis TaxID=1028742 RepID=A0A6I4SQB8_9SPHN|nr:TraB/GumN family protein [Pontixanthobacter gangjinensis]MXO57047.1 TraB/GumN family protein [Pontixanthobacter gangjinensis]